MKQIGLLSHHRDLARELATHEIGHLAMAIMMGFKTGEVTLAILENMGHHGTSEIILAQPLTSIEEIDHYLAARIKVLFAGSMAQTLRAGQEFKGVDNERACEILTSVGKGSDQDWARAREHLQLLRNLRHPDSGVEDEDLRRTQMEVIQEELWLETIEALNANARPIVSLALVLAEKLKWLGTPERLSESDYKREWFDLAGSST